MAGTGTPATALLAKQKVEHRVHTYTHRGGQAYGPEAAEELGLEPARVFKTLVAEVDGTLTVGIVPVSATLDLKALAAAVGGKRARMADVAAAERATGYVAGGISPLGQRKRLRTVVDTSAQDLPTMFCSGGRRGLEVELAPTDLARLTGSDVRPDRRLTGRLLGASEVVTTERPSATRRMVLPRYLPGAGSCAAWPTPSPSGPAR